MTRAIKEVVAERKRQHDKGWDVTHDRQRHPGMLACAACAYAQTAATALAWELPTTQSQPQEPPPLWPFEAQYWRPGTPRRNLVKAAALILAEIDRMDAIND